MAMGLPHVCRLRLQVTTNTLPAKHHTPKIHLPANNSGRHVLIGFGGHHLPTIKWKGQQLIEEHAGIFYNMMASLIGAMGVACNVEYRQIEWKGRIL